MAVKYFISGPHGNITAFNKEDVDHIIRVLCGIRGDDPEEFTVTELDLNE